MWSEIAKHPELSATFHRRVKVLQELGASWHLAVATACTETFNEATGHGLVEPLPAGLCGCVSCRAGCRPDRCEEPRQGSPADAA
jgi:hypothetical protein